jgi:hypothetical protein
VSVEVVNVNGVNERGLPARSVIALDNAIV